jgi:cation diffusion facilitator family transporter
VIALTVATMLVEIAAGSWFGSLALLADGWHMASHASALGITAFAYAYARRHARSPRFAFGTWKVEVLGGFASAVVLGVVAALIAWESLARLRSPVPIRFDEAIAVAALGLGVNLVSAWLLRGRRHPHEHAGASGSGDAFHQDHNLRAAYLHVLSDALTSLFAIAALGTGKLLGWLWLDAAVGLLGSAIIGRWSLGLLRDTSSILLDGDVEPELAARVRREIEQEADTQVVDLHVWRVGPEHLYAVVSLVTHAPRLPAEYKARLERSLGLRHVTVEVNVCAACDGDVASPS